MRSDGKAFLDACATGATILTGECRLNRYDRDSMNLSVVGEPGQEPAPGNIADALGQFVVLDKVTYLKMFIGNQIVRCDQRACRLASKVFTLPLHFQIRFS